MIRCCPDISHRELIWTHILTRGPQDAECDERSVVLQRVFHRYTTGKLVVTDAQPDVSGSPSLSMLIRSLISPISSNRAVFEHIVSFGPTCFFKRKSVFERHQVGCQTSWNCCDFHLEGACLTSTFIRILPQLRQGCLLFSTLSPVAPLLTQASFIPLPRLWDDSLEKLRRRCHIDATEVRMIHVIVFALRLCYVVHSSDMGVMSCNVHETRNVFER